MAIAKHWSDHIEAWQNSGLTQAAYCRLHNLNAKSFSGRLTIYRKNQPGFSPTMIPVQVKPSPSAAMVLRRDNGYRLELPMAISAIWLAELLQCLG